MSRTDKLMRKSQIADDEEFELIESPDEAVSIFKQVMIYERILSELP